MKQVKRTIHYPELMFRTLTELSESTGLSLSEIVRRAIDEYLERKDQK